ncbi:hypothetical protein MUK42_03693 [Musa troglodytarum]|uniref:Uncharacterized protein n=1 Tax=Musa troglodytarum TaxID=320322 RepID=A0A9E7JKN2_9LILI|nr:hypothetical protein MUK42_03693 [Musa troglodytarum]
MNAHRLRIADKASPEVWAWWNLTRLLLEVHSLGSMADGYRFYHVSLFGALLVSIHIGNIKVDLHLPGLNRTANDTCVRLTMQPHPSIVCLASPATKCYALYSILEEIFLELNVASRDEDCMCIGGNGSVEAEKIKALFPRSRAAEEDGEEGGGIWKQSRRRRSFWLRESCQSARFARAFSATSARARPYNRVSSIASATYCD